MSNAMPSKGFRTSVTATLSVRNWARAIDFYKAAFGASELYRVEGGGVGQLSVSGAAFWVAEESPEHLNFSPESLGGCSVRMLVSWGGAGRAVCETTSCASLSRVWVTPCSRRSPRSMRRERGSPRPARRSKRSAVPIRSSLVLRLSVRAIKRGRRERWRRYFFWAVRFLVRLSWHLIYPRFMRPGISTRNFNSGNGR